MGLRNRLQTASAIQNDPGLISEQKRFAEIVDRIFNREESDEIIADGYQDEPENRRELKDAAEVSFLVLWDEFLDEYRTSRSAVNVIDHKRFTALLNQEGIYAQYDYQDLLRARLMPDIIRRRKLAHA